MFAMNTNEVQMPQEETTLPAKSLLKKTLSIYKKLKIIAKQESKTNSGYRTAKLTQNQINKIKSFESNNGVSITVYEKDPSVFERKSSILDKIESLLDQYLKINSHANISKQTESGFDKFFE